MPSNAGLQPSDGLARLCNRNVMAEITSFSGCMVKEYLADAPISTLLEQYPNHSQKCNLQKENDTSQIEHHTCNTKCLV